MNIRASISNYFYSFTIGLFIISALISFFILSFFTPETYSNPAISKQTKIEIALVYIGCSTCGAANDPTLPETLVNLSKKLHKVAEDKKFEYMLIGISSEQKVDKGLKHLEFTTLEYDEIAIGNGLGNSLLQKYIWENYEDYTSPGLPQVLVLKRKYDVVLHNEIERIQPNIVSEQILYQTVGTSGIAKTTQKDLLSLIEKTIK